MPDEVMSRLRSRVGTAFASPAFAMVSLAVTAILVKLPTLDTGAYWDEIGYLGQARWLSEVSLLKAIPGLRPAGAFFGHPPGLFLILAALGKIFGVSVNTAHLLIAVFAAVGVCATFLVARYWHGIGAAWLAAFLLLLSPVYLGQSGFFLADVPVAALGALATYFLLTDRYGPYVACASAMVLLKETAIALVVALLLYRFVVLNPFRQARFRDVARYSVPLAVIGAFMLLQKATTGYFFFIYNFDTEMFVLTRDSVRYQVGAITRWIFIDQYRFIFTALIALNLLANARARRRELWLFAFLAGNGETSLRYLDIVAMHRAAIDRIAVDRPEARVLTTWPLRDELTQPLFGYVERPIDAKGFRADSDLSGADLVLVSQPANGPEVRLRELARQHAWRLIMRQKKESAWIELYARPNPPAPPPSR